MRLGPRILLIKGDRLRQWLFLANLTIGLTGLVLLSRLEGAFRSTLKANAQILSASDISVSARRPLTEKELAAIQKAVGKEAVTTQAIDLFSMLSSPSGSRLVQLRTVEALYPLYGTIFLAGQTAPAVGGPKNGIWIDAGLTTQLSISVGQRVKLGEQDFEVEGVLAKDVAEAVGMRAALAPRVYLSLENLAATKLIQKGSLATHRMYVKLPDVARADEIAESLNRSLDDPGVEVTSAARGSEQIGTLMKNVSDYLGLTSLVALFLGGVGAAYMFQLFLRKKLKEMAILLCLGLSPREVQRTMMLHVAFLSLAATTLAALFSVGLFPFLRSAISTFSPVKITETVSPLKWLISAGGALGISFLICLPWLRGISRVRPQALFQEDSMEGSASIPFSWPALFPAVLAFWMLSAYQANSWKVGSIFFGLFAATVAALWFVFWAIRGLFSMLTRAARFPVRLGATLTSRASFHSTASMLSLGVAVLLISLIHQVGAGLDRELSDPPGEKPPDLFLFDIQEDQLSSLKERAGALGTTFADVSPLIRARWVSVNGQIFTKELQNGEAPKTREQETEARFRNRSINLTWRDRLSASETIVDGRAFSNRFAQDRGKPAEISIEKRYAERLGLKLGDRLAFDVQGVPVEGNVVNFRRVRWASFQPNFFIQFQSGVLDEAPKTYLASLSATNLDAQNIQTSLTKEFPNVSIIDVRRTLSKIRELFSQMSTALLMMSLLVAAAGATLFISVSLHQVSQRAWDIRLLRSLGWRSREVRMLLLTEFGLIGFTAAPIGMGISFVLSYIVSRILFDRLWFFSPIGTLAAGGAAIFVALLTGWIAAVYFTSRRPGKL